jgi:hypothetical protein
MVALMRVPDPGADSIVARPPMAVTRSLEAEGVVVVGHGDADGGRAARGRRGRRADRTERRA